LLEPEKELKRGLADTVNYIHEWDSKGAVQFLASATWQTSPLAASYSQDADLKILVSVEYTPLEIINQ